MRVLNRFQAGGASLSRKFRVLAVCGTNGVLSGTCDPVSIGLARGLPANGSHIDLNALVLV